MTYDLTKSYEMFERAERVIPGGIHGTRTPRFATFGDFPAFLASADGCRLVDVDGNEYVDFMCAYGPILLGYGHPGIERAAADQDSQGNAMTMPSERTVELAEALVERWPFADWVMFGKNGSDVTTLSTRIARYHTGRSKILVAAGAYHTVDPWLVPGGQGVPESWRADVVEFQWNDAQSVHDAFDGNRGDVAGVIINPIKHDAMHDIEFAERDFLDAIQERASSEEALFIIDDVRCGFRLHPSGSSVAFLGVEPDLVCYGKALGNGHPIAVLVGREAIRDTARNLYFSATHFFSATPKAAALATLAAYDEEGAYESIQGAGHMLHEGLKAAAAKAGVGIRMTGPAAMPNLILEDDPLFRRGRRFSGLAARRAIIFHPRHNWFISAAHTPDDVTRGVSVAEECFRIVAEEIESGDLE